MLQSHIEFITNTSPKFVNLQKVKILQIISYESWSIELDNQYSVPQLIQKSFYKMFHFQKSTEI